MKDKIETFIHSLFAEYECEPSEFLTHWRILSVPTAIIFQVLFFLYEYYFETPDYKMSGIEAIIGGIWWAFGGLGIYYLLTLAMIILSAIINKKPFKIIMIVLGAIGTFFAYHRIH